MDLLNDLTKLNLIEYYLFNNTQLLVKLLQLDKNMIQFFATTLYRYRIRFNYKMYQEFLALKDKTSETNPLREQHRNNVLYLLHLYNTSKYNNFNYNRSFFGESDKLISDSTIKTILESAKSYGMFRVLYKWLCNFIISNNADIKIDLNHDDYLTGRKYIELAIKLNDIVLFNYLRNRTVNNTSCLKDNFNYFYKGDLSKIAMVDLAFLQYILFLDSQLEQPLIKDFNYSLFSDGHEALTNTVKANKLANFKYLLSYTDRHGRNVDIDKFEHKYDPELNLNFSDVSTEVLQYTDWDFIDYVLNDLCLLPYNRFRKIVKDNIIDLTEMLNWAMFYNTKVKDVNNVANKLLQLNNTTYKCNPQYIFKIDPDELNMDNFVRHLDWDILNKFLDLIIPDPNNLESLYGEWYVNNILQAIVIRSDPARLNKIMQKYPSIDLLHRYSNGRTLLNSAVEGLNLKMLNYLLDNYPFDINQGEFNDDGQPNNYTILAQALKEYNIINRLDISYRSSSYDIVKTLLEHGADPNIVDIIDISPYRFETNDQPVTPFYYFIISRKPQYQDYTYAEIEDEFNKLMDLLYQYQAFDNYDNNSQLLQTAINNILVDRGDNEIFMFPIIYKLSQYQNRIKPFDLADLDWSKVNIRKYNKYAENHNVRDFYAQQNQ